MRAGSARGVALVMALLVLGILALLTASNLFLAVLHAAAARAAWQGASAAALASGAVALAVPEVEGSAPAGAAFGPWPDLGLPFGSTLEPLAGPGVWRLRAEAAVGTATARSEVYFVAAGGSGALTWSGAR